MKIAIHQPNFLPWIGYFHKIAKVDIFVLFDDVQLPRGKSYCSRTKILRNGKTNWLTIPILNKSEMGLIKDAKVDINQNWKKKHLKTLELTYKKADFFDIFFPLIEDSYLINSHYLLDYNIPLLLKFSREIGLITEFVRSSEIKSQSNKKASDRILEISTFLNANVYFSGSGAGSNKYIYEDKFKEKDIKVEWQKFTFFKYNQIGCDEFVTNISIIDLLFNLGPESGKILKSI